MNTKSICRLGAKFTTILLLSFTLSSCGDQGFAIGKSAQAGIDQEAGQDSDMSAETEVGNEDENNASELPLEPVSESNEHASNSTSFLTLPDGRQLSDIKVRGSSLRLATGKGSSFSSSKQEAYRDLKRESQSDSNHKVQWTFMNLETGEVIERSLGADRKIFGASSSKIYVGAALLDRNNGVLNRSETQQMADMLVVSSNTAWKDMQRDIGGGSSNRGRERIHEFTQRMGYEKTRGFQGYWGSLHGNELTPDESAATLYDIYQNNFPGAETLWKIMYTCRTGTNRGRKYLPSDLYVGGKTGSYSGPTENPQTGETYNVRVKNHLLIFEVDGIQYGLAVLANSGTDESAALLAGGLIREYTSIN